MANGHFNNPTVTVLIDLSDLVGYHRALSGHDVNELLKTLTELTLGIHDDCGRVDPHMRQLLGNDFYMRCRLHIESILLPYIAELDGATVKEIGITTTDLNLPGLLIVVIPNPYFYGEVTPCGY